MSIIELILRRRFPHRHGGVVSGSGFSTGKIGACFSLPKAEGVSQLEGQGEDDLPWRSSLGPEDGGRRGIGEVGSRTIELRSMVCGIYMDSTLYTEGLSHCRV